MNRAIPPLLAVLLGLSLTVVPIVAEPGGDPSSPSVPSVQRLAAADEADTDLQTFPNTTNRLSLDNASRHGYATPGSSIGMVLASTDDKLRVDHVQHAVVDRRFTDATAEERRAMLQTAYDRLKEQSDALEARERRAVRAHANGELSSSRLLQTLLRNYREAAALSETLTELERRSESLSGVSLSAEDEQGKLEMHQTEIRSQLASAARGETGDSVAISVSTSQNGYVLSTVNENYIREAVRFDNRDTSKPMKFDDLTDAYDYTLGLYPWANETRQSPSFNEHTTAQLYLLDVGHGHGSLKTYLDGGTGTIHREVQVLNQNSLPTTSQHIESTDVLKLSINETVGSGPSKLVLTNSTTETPESATVTVDGTEIGETGDDGTLWFVPPGETYDLTVTTGTKRINASVEAD